MKFKWPPKLYMTGHSSHPFSYLILHSWYMFVATCTLLEDKYILHKLRPMIVIMNKRLSLGVSVRLVSSVWSMNPETTYRLKMKKIMTVLP